MPVPIVYFLNEYKLSSAVSSRAGVHVGMVINVFSAIETQSREISGRNASYTIESWDFSTPLRFRRNDSGEGSTSVIRFLSE